MNIEPFDLHFYQRALIAAIIIGFTNGYASALVVLRQSSLKLSAIAHSLLPGVAIAAMLFGLSSWSAFFGSIFAGLIVGLASISFSKATRLDQDSILAIFYTFAFSVGVLILNRLQASQQLAEWLWGNILGLSDTDLWMSFGIGVIAVGSLALFRRPIVLTLFEPEVASTVGVPVRLVNYAIFALLILVLCTTLQAVGGVVGIGLLVAPAASAHMFSNSPGKVFIWGGVIGMIGSVAGLILSYHLNLPAGSSIVMILGGIFILSTIFSPHNSFWRKLFASKNHQH